MASSRDVKDIMGLGDSGSTAVPAQQLAKKPKSIASKRLTGINREVLALHGDRAPPVSIIDSTKTFRAKIKRDFRPAHWDFAPFTNEARRDDLQLRHWKRRKTERSALERAESDAMDLENQNPDVQEPYRFSKYNVDVSVPQYDDEKYERHLKSGEWSREETDYLIELVKDYAQKWPIIIDRYDWGSASQAGQDNTMALAKTQETRTLEALKARYYQVWAKCLAIEHGGESGMNETEFQLYETLTKYNPENEAQRKDLGWRLFERPLEDIREEEYLLSELQRIMINAQRMDSERAEIRARLEPARVPNASGTVPTSSQELNALYNQMFAQDRNKRARGRLSNNANELASPATAGVNGTPVTATAHRDSIASAGGSAQKKGSVSLGQPLRQLDPRTEAKFGITSHDRLTSGVSFRSDKLLKMRQAKSQIQTQKIAAALVELGVQDVLQLPTQRVLDAFERLVGKVTRLVDARKLVEKEEAEARVQGALRKELQIKDEDVTADGEVKAEEDNENEAEEEEEEEANEVNEENDENDENDEEKDGDEDEDDGEGDAEVDAEVDVDDVDGSEDSQFEGNGEEEDGDDDGDGDANEDGDRDEEVDDDDEEVDVEADADEMDIDEKD